jgi:hypothetical protein
VGKAAQYLRLLFSELDLSANHCLHGSSE